MPANWWDQNTAVWQQPQGQAGPEGGTAPAAQAAAPTWVPGAKAGQNVVISGFDTAKLMNPNGHAVGSKYDDPARAFAESIQQDVGWTRGSDNTNALNFLKAQGFTGAHMVGDDKVDFGDGQGPIDIFRGSDGALVFQNTTGNPVWEGQQRARAGGAAAPMALGNIGNVQGYTPPPMAPAQAFDAGVPPPQAAPTMAQPPLQPPADERRLLAAAYAPRTVQGPQAAALRIPGFATGVQNFSGGPAIVGERGPELLNLPPGSDVLPMGTGANLMTLGGGAPTGEAPRNLSDALPFGGGAPQTTPLDLSGGRVTLGGGTPTSTPIDLGGSVRLGGGAPMGPPPQDLGGPAPQGAFNSTLNGAFAYSPMAAPANYNPAALQGPDRLSLGSIGQPAAVTPDRVSPGAAVGFDRISGQTVDAPGQIGVERVQGPSALTAQQLRDPGAFSNLSLAQFQADPSYQFDRNEQLGAIQNSAAAKGLLHHPNTLRGLQETASNLANRQYDTVNARNLALQQQNFGNQATVAGANNAANAQAYGLTNQFQQQAALANQGAALEAGKFNVATGLQAGQFNAGQQQQAALANQQAGLQSGQFNSAQAQQAALANQQANLNAGQFNAQMGFNTQQQNLANQLAAYNAYQPLAQQNAQFNAAQQAAAAQNNFANQFSVNQANNAGQLGAFNANLGAELGRGNLALGQTQAANSYNLGLGNLGVAQGQLALGNRQADQSYNLGLGNLGVSQGQLGLAQQGQQFNQDLNTFNTNYGVFRDNRDTQFAQDLARTQIGANAAGNYGNQAGALYSGQGNANAGATIGQGNAWAGALGNIGNMAGQAGFYYGGTQVQPPNLGVPVYAGLPGGALPGTPTAAGFPTGYYGTPVNIGGYPGG